MREKVTEEIAALRQGDVIEVKWLDACKFLNAKKDYIRNKQFATYKRVLGRYLGIRIDALYHEPYMIIIVSEEDTRIDFVSIPLKTVMRIHRFNKGRFFKAMSEVGIPYLSGGTYGRIIEIKEGIGEHDESENE